MRLIVSGATREMDRLASGKHRDRLGTLLTAKDGNDIRLAIRRGLPYAIDNSAFTGLDLEGLWDRLADAWEMMTYCPPEWLAAPDVVGDPVATLRQFHEWKALLDYEIGYSPVPLAYVLQDGQEMDAVPWDDIDAVFVGGSTEYKFSAEAAALCQEAKRRGLKVHVGRVNTLRRIRYAQDVLQADTIDGSGFSRFPQRIEWACDRMQAEDQQLRLFAA